MLNEKGEFILDLGIKPTKLYEAILRPNRDKNGFIEKARSTRFPDLEYFVVDLEPAIQIDPTTGLEIVERRSNNPTICIFSEWNSKLFGKFEDKISINEPKPNVSFRTKLGIKGAFYSADGAYQIGEDIAWDNVLLFVDADDNLTFKQIEEQYKYAFRALLVRGAKFDEEEQITEWLADVLAKYPLPEPTPPKSNVRRGRR